MEHYCTDLLMEARYQEALTQAKSLVALTERLVLNPNLLQTQYETIIALSIILHDLRRLITAIEDAVKTSIQKTNTYQSPFSGGQ